MRIALGQINPIIGDLKGNCDLILDACLKAAKENANLLVTPELSLWGYPPKDLLLNPVLINEQWAILDTIVASIASKTPDLSLIVGIAETIEDAKFPPLFNSIVLINQKGWEVIARKQLLPTYDVFDEKRYFRSTNKSNHITIQEGKKSWNIGLTICEDLWVEEEIQDKRVEGTDPITQLETVNVDFLLNLSASPFAHQKYSLRHNIAAKAAKRLKCPVVYVNQVGANDELVFDGGSFVVDSEGKILIALPHCQESIAIWETGSQQIAPLFIDDPKKVLLDALVLGVRDYAKKCGFSSALIGLSGGIDSALVAVIATAALGKKNVSAILMPSPWSSSDSVTDANSLVKRLGINSEIIPIESLMTSYDLSLKTTLKGLPHGLTAENLQARIRGTLLMAIANQNNHLLLATGNKSELAVGYCTLYGDMNGGLAVIGDLYKTSVFKLCDWIDSPAANRWKEFYQLPNNKELIGLSIRQKQPSAELRPGQLDIDSLPEYEKLDPILKGLIEKKRSLIELVNQGHEPNLIKRIQKLLKKSEFKRRQAPPMLKVSNQAFGSGWRIPIAATYSE
tara:strand:+ start:36 stop:1736 length:1701 start_codon:yes stop_codon:yes gene_type:complete